MNHLLLTASIAELKALRYTPAGLPAQDLVLEHESQVEEAGQSRLVKATLRAVAFGAVAERMRQQAVGSSWRFAGFVANQRAGKGLVLHVQEFQPVSTESSGAHHGRT
ncbi:primosomal replication protein N [Pseudorhodoferax sp.]|uniref:primosomal replication protein N n=1 Tax=Pseudorhodoferax sp. TaxID=1993553 RepID=UPI0039E4762D